MKATNEKIDLDIRGLLASRLTCWHRLTCKESDELVALFKAQPEQEPVVQCLEAIMELADKYATAMERGPFSRSYQGNIQDARENLQAAVEKIVTPPQRKQLPDALAAHGIKE